GDVAPAERAVKPAEQADQNRFLAAKIFERDFAFLGDGVEYDIRRLVARLKGTEINGYGHRQLPARLVEKRQYHERFRIQPVLGANSLRQGKVAFRLGQVIEVEIERCQSIIARKKELRLTCFARYVESLAVETGRKLLLPVALVDLAEHNQRDRQMFAL